VTIISGRNASFLMQLGPESRGAHDDKGVGHSGDRHETEEAASMAYQVIVVGTDGSERASKAVDEAMGFAEQVGGELHAVRVVHPAVEAGYVESRSGQLVIDRVRQDMAVADRQLVDDADRRGISLVIHNPGGGDPADALLDMAESVNADVIVVGNRGIKNLTRFLQANVPNKVAHRSSRSVLIVNTGEG
jgi:nucleotide-binding universal stress UspA family protein